MNKKKVWDRSLGPDAIATINAEENAHSTKFDIESVLIPHIRNYFSKVKDTNQ